MKKHTTRRSDDVVDDVIKNILPRFWENEFSPSDTVAYATALSQIYAAFCANISQERKSQLVEELSATHFVLVSDAHTGGLDFLRPDLAYIPKEPLRSLFAGISKVRFVDMTIGDRSYEDKCTLLCACGAKDFLQIRYTVDRITPNELLEFRCLAGTLGQPTIVWHFEDHALCDLAAILTLLPELPIKEAAYRALLLWKALGALAGRCSSCFFSEYYWYSNNQANHWSFAAHFDPAFVKDLRHTPWVPKPDGTLGLPSEVVFEDLGPDWTPNSFLLSRIPFKPRTSGSRSRHHAVVAESRHMTAHPSVEASKQISTIVKDIGRAWRASPNLALDAILAKAALQSCIVSYFEINNTQLLKRLRGFGARRKQTDVQISVEDYKIDQNPRRIPILLKALKKAWLANPDLRLGQLLTESVKLHDNKYPRYAGGPVICREFFNVSDEAMLQGIRLLNKNPTSTP